MTYPSPLTPMPRKPSPHNPAPPSPPGRRAPATHAQWTRIDARLSELALLPANWDDHGAAAIGPQCMMTTRQLLLIRPALAEASELFPTVEGGILVEFVHNGWDLTIEVGPTGTLEIYGFQIGGSDQLLPQAYSSLDDLFLKQFDSLGEAKWRRS